MNRIEKLQSFLTESPDDCFLKHALALEYIKEGKEDVARELFESNLTIDPDYLATYYHLGKLLERKAEFSAALELYKNGAMRAVNDAHARSELQRAAEDLADELF